MIKKSPKIAIKKVSIGKGLVATSKLKKEETVAHIGGKILSADFVTKKRGKLADNAIRFSENTYLSPDSDLGDYANHSCSPNTKIVKKRNKLFLVALSNIRKGEEVVFDYSTILAKDDIWKMKCFCESENCRGTISNYSKLPSKVYEDYKRDSVIPKYILDIE